MMIVFVISRVLDSLNTHHERLCENAIHTHLDSGIMIASGRKSL